MGNEGSSLRPHGLLTEADLRALRASFPNPEPDRLWGAWTRLFDAAAVTRLEALFRDASAAAGGGGGGERITFQAYQNLAGNLAKGGDAGEKVKALVRLGGGVGGGGEAVELGHLKLALERLLKAYAAGMADGGGGGRRQCCFRQDTAADVEALAASLLHDLEHPGRKRKETFAAGGAEPAAEAAATSLGMDDVETWLLGQPLVEHAMTGTFHLCFFTIEDRKTRCLPSVGEKEEEEVKSGISVLQVRAASRFLKTF